MADFFGKTYRYGKKVIGVQCAKNPDLFMVCHKTGGGYKQFKPIPVCLNVEKAQTMLDTYAIKKGLEEVTHAG